MFKPGEIAVIKAERSGQIRESDRTVTILASTPEEMSRVVEMRWPVKTSGGVFDETELFPAHPTVIATATVPTPLQDAQTLHENVMARIKKKYGISDDDDDDESSDDESSRMSYDLLAKVEKILGKASVDLNGHWRSGADIDRGFKILETVFLNRDSLSKKDAEDLAAKKLDRWVPVPGRHLLSSLRTCPCCGKEKFTVETNGKVVRISGEPCEFPNGLPPTEWELNVPSGRLVIANDLREIFPLPEDEDFNINTSLGCRQTALAYAANGMSHAFVGNSCPSVYKCKDGTFKIANSPRDEEWDEKKKKYVKIRPKPAFDGKKVASICTDLWWYSICDHAEFERRCARFGEKGEDGNVMYVCMGNNNQPVVRVGADAEDDASPADYADCAEFTAAVHGKTLHDAVSVLKRRFGATF